MHAASRRRLLAALPVLGAACAAAPDAADGPGPSGAIARQGLDDVQRRLLQRHREAHLPPPPPAGVAVVRAGRAAALPLVASPRPLEVRWRLDGAVHDVDAYLARQPAVALLVVRGTALRIQRYRHGVGGSAPWLGNSMTKTVTALAIGFALEDGRLASIDAPAQRHVPALAGSAYGETTVRNLLRMASGVRFTETYEPDDDWTQFSRAAAREGIVAAAHGFDARTAPQGTRFAYASIESHLLGAVLRGATGSGLAAWTESRLWGPMGAAHDAAWRVDRTGLEFGGGGFAASPHDWARLGVLLAHDGVRPDTGRRVLPADYLADMTRTERAEPPFRPDATKNRFGYGYQTWIAPGARRQFALFGVHGQAVFVDPDLRLAMVHLAINTSPSAEKSSMARERFALWNGVVRAAEEDARA